MSEIKDKKPKTERYFGSTVEEGEVKEIKLKPKHQQKFSGEMIQFDVDLKKPLSRHNQFKRQFEKKFNPDAKFQKIPKKKRIPKEVLEKYEHGESVDTGGVKTKFFKAKQQRKEVYLEYAAEQAARTELLLEEGQGFLEPDEDEITASYRQEEIAQNVDIQAASKFFKLNLDFGPYSMRYTKNGRHLLLGGRRGHVCAFDWVTKKLHCEMNVMEEVADVAWLHVPTMFACAQKKYVNVYDNQGTELHCVKRLYRVNRLEFLPYHFLLAAANTEGYLSWLDVSIGELVGNFNTRLGDIRLMRNNPSNGVVCVGGGKGVVSMWSPKVREPLAKMLVHPTPMSAMTIDPKGMHLVTAGLDRFVKVWDLRALSGPLATYKLNLAANQVEVSQRGVLAFSQGNHCELYSNLLAGGGETKTPYQRRKCEAFVSGMRFCPYEDVLGIATAKGFQSLLVPGSGEPNFDALEDNPFQTKSQRREQEVHALLEKIPAELITLDPNEISAVDVPTLQEKIDAKRAVFFVKPPQLAFKARHKMKGRGGSANAAKNKQIVKDMKRKKFIEQIRKAKQEVIAEAKEKTEQAAEAEAKKSVLDRFKARKVKTKKPEIST